jgi:acyl-coenzyme A synthetase/AMP-(fatty) acid ligase
VGKLAALSDGKFVYHGREGDMIEGRYRIVKIGVESIVMEHADGRGRQTIRLTG